MEQHHLARLEECMCPSMALCSIREGVVGAFAGTVPHKTIKGTGIGEGTTLWTLRIATKRCFGVFV